MPTRRSTSSNGGPQEANIKLRVLAEQLLADFRALNYDDTLPERPVFDQLLLTAHNRVRR